MRRSLFIVTIFLNSGLLFLIEPMVARMILPAFGGSPAVWTASMVFFQGMLLLGYAYAHLTTKWLGVSRQPWLHLGLMAVAAFTLPFALPAGAGALGSADPTARLLGTLALMVGAVFFTVSAGAPLLQRWFSVTDDPAAKDPYFLYSASNAASLIALLAYPFFVEPSLRLGEQSRLWSGGYLLLIVFALGAAVVCLRAPKGKEVAEHQETATISNRQRLLWVALAAVPSSLLLGVTSFLTTNIAPIPLLWVVPLSVYLLTFILAFARRQILTAKLLGRIAPLLAIPLALMIILESENPIEPIALVHLATFFVLAWMCHARLNETRPSVGGLTEFYVWISLGGVVGGLFNAVIAPNVFSTLAEYPLALVAAVMLRPAISIKNTAWDWTFPALVAAAAIAGVLIVHRMGMQPTPARTMATIGLPLILCIFAMDRPVRFGLCLGAVFLVANYSQITSENRIVLKDRSFFGVHRVSVDRQGRFFELLHGITKHGRQDRLNPTVPLTYYHPSGPIGHVFTAFSGPWAKRHVGLVGMGVGSLAAYGEPGQRMTFFEIDPVVVRIATDPRLFTFIRDSKANVDIVLGDGRLTLERQLDHEFGLLVLDAFNSDSVPVHLLTREAFKLYLQKLESDGVIAVHISNRYLDLEPVLRELARSLRLQIKSFTDGVTDEEKAVGKMESTWVVVARRESDFGPLNEDHDWGEASESPGMRVWTDDYSNLLKVFRPEDR